MGLETEEINTSLKTDASFYDLLPSYSTEEEETEEERKKREEEERRLEEQNRLEDIQRLENIQNQNEELIDEQIVTEETTSIKEESSFYDSLNDEPIIQDDEEYYKLDKNISTTRQLQYGARQEKTILGNIFQLGGAVFNKEEGETFKQAARRIERERQEEILKDYPEFRNKQESWTVISGRMGVAIADPVTLLVPWTKIAKAGKLASVSVGGSVAASDMALREYTLYGDVSAKNVGLGFALGGSSSLISGMIANKFLSSKADNVPVKPLDNATKKGLAEAGEETAFESQPFFQAWSDGISSAGIKYTQRDLILDEIKILNKKIKNIRSPRKGAKITAASKKQLAKKTDLQTQVKVLKDELAPLLKEIDELTFIKMPENSSIIGFNSLKNLWNKKDDKGVRILEGKFSQSLFRAFVQETVRPLFGATSGGLVALGFSDGESDDFLTNAMLTGATFGFLMKRIQVSNFGLRAKEIEILNKEFQTEFKLQWRTGIKQMLSGSQATYFQAGNEIMQGFGNIMFKNQGLGVMIGKPLPDAIETLSAAAADLFRSKLFRITGTASDTDVAAATRLLQERNMPSTSKHSFLDPGDLDNKAAQKMADDVFALQEEFKIYVRETGLTFKEVDSYGLTQIFNPEAAGFIGAVETLKILKEAFRIQNINLHKLDPKKYKLLSDTSGKPNGSTVDEKLERIAKNYLDKSDSIRRKEILNSENLMKEIDALSTQSGKAAGKEDTLIQSARFFDNERVLFDQEARAYAKNLFIQDFEFTTNSLFENTIPVVEFARRFGAKGQGITDTIKQLKQFYKNAAVAAGGKGDFTLDVGLRQLYNEDISRIAKGVNSFFGVHDVHKQVPDGWSKSVVMTLQALLSTTKLTKVLIPSLGDLIQVFQNSGPTAAMKSMMLQLRQRGPDALKPSASLGLRSGRIKEGVFGRKDGSITFGAYDKVLSVPFKNRRYNGTLHKEISNFSMNATTSYQRRVQDFQTRFFEIVQLGRITRFAREYAFDAGAIRAFELAKKTKLARRHLKELTDFRISSEQIKYLNKFKTIDDAMLDSHGKRIIERAGRSAADRDALIPTAGNRRLFSQSQDPWFRFMGSFLSWAQAKSTQTNALIGRMEEGDAKLATLMLTTLPIYGSVRQLQLYLNPDSELVEDELLNPFEDSEQLLKFLGTGGMFSGQMYPWFIDKGISTFKYQNDSLAESVYPAYGMTQDFVSGVYKVSKNVASGDGNVAAHLKSFGIDAGEIFVPFGKEFTRRDVVGQLFGYDEDLREEIRAEASDEGPKPKYSVGGIVGEEFIQGPEVPFTQDNAADRINPITGLPYNFQRVQYNNGKIVDPRYEGAKALLRQTHKYAVDNEAYGDDGSGDKVSFHSGVIGKGPKEHYIVNGYNPETNRFETENEIFKRVAPLIKSGQLKPYEDHKIADAERAKMRNEILQETGDK